MLRYSTAIAAGIVVLIAAFFAYQYYSLSPEKVFSANYQAYELSTVRGTNETTVLEEAYRNKNYTEVIRLHATTPDPSIKSDFLAGAAALELNNLPQAKSAFTQVIDRNKKENTRILKDEAEYYLALTLVRQKDFKAALLLLDRMQNDPDHIYRAKVSDGLLRDVRKLSRR
jgi:tetratricopeptide (TPR) repeat protein